MNNKLEHIEPVIINVDKKPEILELNIKNKKQKRESSLLQSMSSISSYNYLDTRKYYINTVKGRISSLPLVLFKFQPNNCFYPTFSLNTRLSGFQHVLQNVLGILDRMKAQKRYGPIEVRHALHACGNLKS